jgi:hypothetical protein
MSAMPPNPTKAMNHRSTDLESNFIFTKQLIDMPHPVKTRMKPCLDKLTQEKVTGSVLLQQIEIQKSKIPNPLVGVQLTEQQR